MRFIHESTVTADGGERQIGIGPPDADGQPAAGVWKLVEGEWTPVDAQGPATLLVPTESVLLLAVHLPLPTRAKRLQALPFAVEDRIAEPLDTVHLALGAELSPRRYLVAVVRHDLMARWVESAEDAGLGHAAMVPDALALPMPPEGEWWVDLDRSRAVVRTGEGGFACPVPLLRPAWEAAGRPPFVSTGEAPPEDMLPLGEGRADESSLASRLAAPAVDLRQGIYAGRRAGGYEMWRRFAWILVIGAVVHALIALGDTLMLRAIAERRAEETRALATLAAPGVNLGEDMVATVTGMLPPPGSSSRAVPATFLPLMSRVSAALAPMAGSVAVRSMNFEANTLTMDLDGSEPGLATRVDAALDAAGVDATVTESQDGAIRVSAAAA